MKRLLKTALTTIVFTTFAMCVSNDVLGSSFPTQTMSMSTIYYSTNDNINDPNRGHRNPPKPVECTISPEGVIFYPSSDAYDILLYEICDPVSEVCLASFSAEQDFIEHLFSLSGEFMVRFSTNEFELVGYIEL